jgi:sugar-phosphatase
MRVGHGRQNHEVLRLVAPHLDPAVELPALIRQEEEWVDGIREVPGARALLAALPGQRWAVVTSAWRRLAEIRLGAAGLTVPPVLVSADDVRRSKPHPEGYLAAAERLGVAAGDCVVFEDSPVGIEAGQAAGMRVVAVRTTFPDGRLGGDWSVPDLQAVQVGMAQPAAT